jgi:WD40 repeat protein/serine/threonine protein kinase
VDKPLLTAKAVFDHAHEITDADQRRDYLREACGDNAALRGQVEALLRAYEEAGNFLEQPAAEEGATSDVAPGRWIDPARAVRVLEGPGTRIGPYKLLQQIGEGGMGVVYMAEQEEPVRRKVALKIIKPGMDSRQVIARFEAERQALAMMDHQNIARVFDAGTTESGRPYFVMELVHGVPITKFCDDNKLTPRERLALFVPVCQAIQHAHQKGIIHRDVKPSNVLVTMYDDKPVPKVIDFGVAKAIEQRLTEKTMFTQFGALVGTFEYMSPEQAEMNAFGVDTRSDIYSLGVLLYELLTGTTPLERSRLREAALNELVRLIKEEEAQRPSQRLSSSNNLPKIAAARKTEPARLSKLVRGELDWIVMRCLEKDRSRRYETANSLARDVERYLADEPVEACPPSASYRLGKLARKYKKPLVTAAAFAILLITGTVVSALLAVWAKSAEREANGLRIASDDAKRDALEAKTEADKQRDAALLTAYAAGMNLARHYWEDDNVGRARELLDEVPREAGGEEVRGFEWHYLHRLCHSELQTLKGHALGAWSPDGQRLVLLGLADKTVKILDTATGKELHSLKGHAGTVVCVAFSPTGRYLASGSEDKSIRIWESSTGTELRVLEGHAGRVAQVAFSPNGKYLASSGQDQTVRIWDSLSGKEQFSIPACYAFGAWSPDGSLMALMSLGRVRICDSTSGKELASLPIPKYGSGFGAWGSDGRLLASTSVGTVKIWDTLAGKELASLAHPGLITSVAFSPDGRSLASASRDMTIKIWEAASGKELLILKGHAGGVSSIAFSPDGERLASGSEDSIVKIWDSATGQELASLKGHTGGVGKVAFSADGLRLASESLELSAEGERRAVGVFDRTVKIWDCDTAKGQFYFKGDLIGLVMSLAFSRDGQRLASGGSDRTVRIWDRTTGKQLASLKGHTGPVTSIAFSPDGQRLISSSDDHTVKIWDSVGGKELRSFDGVAGWVALSPDGHWLASWGGMEKTVKIWDIVAGKELNSLIGHSSTVLGVTFSPDSRRLATASADQTVKIWDTATGADLITLNGHLGNVSSVAFSPDGRLLASGGWDQMVKIWDTATNKVLFTLKGHAAKNGTGKVSSLVFSPDSRRLASGSRRSGTKIWDTATGKELYSFKDQGSVMCLAFSQDGQCLASAEGGGIILRETAVQLELQPVRDANCVVADLFNKLGFRADVLERLQKMHGLTSAVRREAFALAQTYAEDATTFNELAWEGVRLPGKDLLEYRKVLRYGEEACRLEPQNGTYLNTLGVAYHRVGNYEKALKTLLRSDENNRKQNKGSLPEDLAFLAMTEQRLGHAKEAQNYLRRLRERMKEPESAGDRQAQDFLREAEDVIEGKPADKKK